jgi:hypothetical protein
MSQYLSRNSSFITVIRPQCRTTKWNLGLAQRHAFNIYTETIGSIQHFDFTRIFLRKLVLTENSLRQFVLAEVLGQGWYSIKICPLGLLQYNVPHSCNSLRQFAPTGEFVQGHSALSSSINSSMNRAFLLRPFSYNSPPKENLYRDILF